MATRHAIILVAGEGKRLRPFTDTQPKCFARVAGRRLLDSALAGLAGAGCRHVRIVAGHHAALVRRTIGDAWAGLDINYVINPDYASTNSMYSLALGLAGWDAPTWVLEGDVRFEPALLGAHAAWAVTWFVDASTRHLDGAYVAADAQGRATGLEIIRDLRRLRPGQAKSVGILKLTRPGARRVRRWLREGVRAGRRNDYYDLILADHLAEGDVGVANVAGHTWYEIDTPEDLGRAAELFA